MAIDGHDIPTIDPEGTTFPTSGTATLARFDGPRGPNTTLAVIADPHLTPTGHGTPRVYHRTKQRFQMAVADAHRLDVDGVVVAGDLTRDGGVGEYALADDLLSTAPAPTITVPGNHDIQQCGPVDSVAQFARRYGHRGYPSRASVGGVSVTALDSTCPERDTVGGRLDSTSLRTLRSHEHLSEPQFAVLHQPLVSPPAPFDDGLSTADYRIANPEETADALVDAGVEVAITGHLHWPYVTTYRGLTVVGAPGCSSFPPAYLLVHLDSRGTTVTLVPLAGESGLGEAYEYALDGVQGDCVRDAVEGGYFGQFPLVDDQKQYDSGPAPPLLEQPAGY